MAITFKHTCNDEKINVLITNYGAEGYYIYFRTVEFFAIRKNKPIVIEIEEDLEELLNFLHMSHINQIKTTYDFIQEKIGLFEPVTYKKDILQLREIKTAKDQRPLDEVIKDKIKVSQVVFLTKEQITEFNTKYGKEFYDRCVEVLNDYKINKHGVATYRDDAAAIRNWVVDRTMKEKRFYNYAFPFLKDQKPEPPKFKRPDATQFKNY